MNIRNHSTELVFLVVLSFVWFVIGWIVHGRVAAGNNDMILIEQVRQTLLDNHVKDLPSSPELTYAALRGMVQKIDDRHAAFLDPLIAERFVQDFNGNSGVVGLFPERLNGEYVIAVVLPGGTAEKAGLQEGDVIVAVDDVNFDQLTTSADVTLLLRGPVGTPAKIVVRRGSELLTFAPIREVRSVTSGVAMLDGSIAYFAQHTFTANSPEEVTAVVSDLMAQQPEGIIWDLRSNGGGSMEAAQDIISLFIKEGLLFQVALKDNETRQIEAEGEAIAADIPLVLLIGGTTFSAAETAAASVQDRGRGILIGDTTYGKGTVQTTVSMPQNTALQFTIAHWLSPNGEWYDGRGVEPDIRMIDDPNTEQDEIIEFAVDWLKQSD